MRRSDNAPIRSRRTRRGCGRLRRRGRRARGGELRQPHRVVVAEQPGRRLPDGLLEGADREPGGGAIDAVDLVSSPSTCKSRCSATCTAIGRVASSAATPRRSGIQAARRRR
jgi:hypothetical protein